MECAAVGGYTGNAHAAGNFHWSYHMWKGSGFGSGRERGSSFNEVVGANESPQCALTFLTLGCTSTLGDHNKYMEDA